jgi:hypothetical protein
MRRTACLVIIALALGGVANASPAPAEQPGPGSGEGGIVVPAPEPPGPAPAPKHLLGSAAITGGAYALLYGWVTLAWYVRTENSSVFHLHDEGWFGADTYAGGADKLGHFWGNYAMTRGVSQVLRWGGWRRPWAIGAAGGLSLAFFTFSEIKDGYKIEYGFSYGDEIANTLGVLLGVAMELAPELDRRLDVRISYLPSSAYLDRLGEEGPFNTPEDYTGQTFYVAYHLGSIDALARRASWTKFLDVGVGYRSRNFKPMPTNGEQREQDLFVGLSFNFQELLDRAVTHGVLHFIGEMYQPPYTTLPLGGFKRYGASTTSTSINSGK